MLTIRKSINNVIKTVYIMIFVFGGLSFLKGCSPERDGEGASGVGGAFQAFDFIFYGVFLLIVSGWAVLLYKASMAKNKVISILAALISITTGLTLLYFGLLNYNPFTRSNSLILYLVPSELIGFFSVAIFIIIGVNFFVIMVQPVDEI